MSKKYKTIYTIIENKLEKLYVSHNEKHSKDTEYETEFFICALPNEKVPVNYFKNQDKKSPRLYIPKTICLL